MMMLSKQEQFGSSRTEDIFYEKEQLAQKYGQIFDAFSTSQYKVRMLVKDQGVEGILFIEPRYLGFFPQENSELMYQTRILWNDVDCAETKIQPNQRGNDHINLIDLLLYKTGKKKIFATYQSKEISHYKEQKQPIARIKFEILSRQLGQINLKEEQIIELMEQIQHEIHNNCTQSKLFYQQQQKHTSDSNNQHQGISIIPHCEILIHNLVNFFREDIKLKYKKIVLDQNDFNNIILNSIPEKFQLFSWQRVYSSNIDGYSYSRFLKKIQSCCLCLVVIQDTKNRMFGAFSNSGLNPNKGFFGDGECFVFSIPQSMDQLKIYKSTLQNNCYIWSSKQEGFGFGCGSGGYSLFVSSNLQNGSSYPSETFNNPILSSQNQFSIKMIEVWGVEEYDGQ
ncbi:hypothetical protein ABPG72_005439 [Tetrahymena utriculariae]